MVAMAKVRRLRGKLNILGARFYDGFGKFARLLLVLGGTALSPILAPPGVVAGEKDSRNFPLLECALLSRRGRSICNGERNGF